MPAPKQPPQTCPAINSIQKDCKEGVELMEKAAEGIESARDFFASIIREIEELREQNEKLRDFGDYYYERCQELESEVSKLEKMAA